MSLVGLALNLLLACLLLAALNTGWRLNRRLKALRDSHDGFAAAVADLNSAASRAEQGLADLRAATDEAVDILGDRIEKGRTLAARLERLSEHAATLQRQPPVAAPVQVPAAEPLVHSFDDPVAERRLSALLAAAREMRAARPTSAMRPQGLDPTRFDPPRFDPRPAPRFRRNADEDDLFDDEPLILDVVRGAAR